MQSPNKTFVFGKEYLLEEAPTTIQRAHQYADAACKSWEATRLARLTETPTHWLIAAVKHREAAALALTEEQREGHLERARAYDPIIRVNSR